MSLFNTIILGDEGREITRFYHQQGKTGVEHMQGPPRTSFPLFFVSIMVAMCCFCLLSKWTPFLGEEVESIIGWVWVESRAHLVSWKLEMSGIPYSHPVRWAHHLSFINWMLLSGTENWKQMCKEAVPVENSSHEWQWHLKSTISSFAATLEVTAVPDFLEHRFSSSFLAPTAILGTLSLPYNSLSFPRASSKYLSSLSMPEYVAILLTTKNVGFCVSHCFLFSGLFIHNFSSFSKYSPYSPAATSQTQSCCQIWVNTNSKRGNLIYKGHWYNSH